MQKLKKQFFSSLIYVWKELKKWGKYIYDKLNILKNLVGIYNKVIKPLYLFLLTCLKWTIPIIVLYGRKYLVYLEIILMFLLLYIS